jgi:hypothetical protein
VLAHGLNPLLKGHITPLPAASDKTRSILIWTLLGAGIVIGIAFVILFVVILSQNGSTNGGIPANAVAPYGLNLRRIPTTQNIQELFPAQYGPFTRKAYSGTLAGNGAVKFSATYQRGTETVIVTGARDNTYNQAQADMKAAVLRIAESNRIVNIGTSFGYLIAPDPKGMIHLIYQHTFWYFEIAASNQQTLDDFVKIFPY